MALVNESLKPIFLMYLSFGLTSHIPECASFPSFKLITLQRVCVYFSCFSLVIKGGSKEALLHFLQCLKTTLYSKPLTLNFNIIHFFFIKH